MTAEMPIVLKAECHILRPNDRIVRSQFDVEPASEAFGEYVLMNIAHERGLLQDGRIYRITIKPFFPHIVKGE
jgi:hypothetical protein